MVSVDGDLQTAAHEEPLIIDDAGIIRESRALCPLGFGDGEVLRGVLPAETGNALVHAATRRALEAKGLGLASPDRRLLLIRHRVLQRTACRGLRWKDDRGRRGGTSGQ